MLKLLRKLSLKDWILVIVLVGLVVVQVYFDMELPDYTNEIVTKITTPGATVKGILNVGWKMLGVVLGSVAASIIVGVIASFIASDFSKKVRNDVFAKVGSFSFEEINKFSTASLITRSTNDVQQVQMAVTMILRLAISAPITAVWAILKINSSSGELTIATAVGISVLVVSLVLIFSIAIPKFKLIQKLTDKLNSVTRENLTGIRVVRAYNAESYEEGKFQTVNENITKTHLFVGRLMGLMSPIMMIVMNGIMLAIYWIGAYLMNDGKLDLGTMTAFTMLAMQVLMSFMMLTMFFIMLPRAQVSANRINAILDTKCHINDPESSEAFITKGEVEFKNVNFRYPDASGYVLKNISFKAKKGDTVAFIGSTGSGKSTIVNLVPRFYDATEGQVLVDGVDIKNVSQEQLRSIIGYVPQKGVLFSGTIKENISFGKEIDEKKLQESSDVAMASSFIEEKENKYEEPISQGGKNVSGGQKQRLSIARAVAIDPEIYIFDDSFSALDYKTDKEVRKRLKEYTKDATCLIVAQRIGTIKDADLIVVLENGEIIGQGTHEELLHNCSVYQEIALSQLSKEELGL